MVQTIDIQAHRGGLGLTVENTMAAFETALDIGVTTLECDVHISRDGAAMVTHDLKVNPAQCRDTAPATPGDPDFPYVGKYFNKLTAAQLETLDVGSKTHPHHPRQRAVPGARMPMLHEIFDLLRERGADDVLVNIETKFEALAPGQTGPRERFVQVVADEARRSGMCDRITVQSFDWGILMRMREEEPRLRLSALSRSQTIEVGSPGASPWLGGIDIDDFGGNLVRAAASFGADLISPQHGEPPRLGVQDPAYRPFVTQAMVDEAHAAGLGVLPWTVDDPATMHAVIDLGVDGIITNYPDLLREVVADRGMQLPPSYPALTSLAEGHG